MESLSIVIYREGWLHKRGEHIKTWRPRYFILKTDGYFLGYNSKPLTQNEIDSPNNRFFIKDCKCSTSEKPKPNVFILKCLTNENSNVERFFAAYSQNERSEWIKSIEHVSKNLNGNFLIQIQKINFEKLTLHDFEYLKILGKGTFGKVILCRERQTKRTFAMKILKKSLIIEKEKIAHTKTENLVMRTLKNPFITSLIYSFQTSELLCLVMEYVNGGELFFHLKRERKFSENKSRFYCAEICYAIGYLHQNNIIYRDIKLENILLDSDGHIKLADFGLCKTNMNHESKTDTICGTLEYLAPEIILRDYSNGEGYTRAVDWWAIGIVLYEMLTGRLPFSFKTNTNNETFQKGFFEKILKEDVRLPLDLSNESKLILTQFLEKNPQKRIGSGCRDFEEIKTHQFFSIIDWKKLENKQLEPPFKPILKSEIDTSYFDQEFTNEPVHMTPTDESCLNLNKTNEINYFDSFSYYGSKTSLLSRISQTSSSSNSSLKDKFDTRSLLSGSCFNLESKHFYNPSNLDEFFQRINKNEASFRMALNVLPNFKKSYNELVSSRMSIEENNDSNYENASNMSYRSIQMSRE